MPSSQTRGCLDETPDISILPGMDRFAPPPEGDHPDRFLRCQEAMEDAFARIGEAAAAVGWSEEEIAAALVELADNFMLAMLANRSLGHGLAILKRP
jgi:hypothetical protein